MPGERNFQKRARLGARFSAMLLVLAAPAIAQISISSIQSSVMGANSPSNVQGITTGSPGLPPGAFEMWINGTFSTLDETTTVVWDDGTGNPFQLGIQSFSANLIQVFVDSDFYVPPVSSVKTITITVTQGSSTASGQFFLNPPLGSVSPPLATVGVPYSTPMQFGGTAPFTLGALTGTLPPGLTPNANGLISGTPTTPGFYSFTQTETDFWGNTFDAPVFIEVVGAATITSVVPNSVPAGTGFTQITINGTNFVDPESRFGGSFVEWIAGTSTLSLSTSFLSATQLQAYVPTALMATAGTAGIAVLQPNNVLSNVAPFALLAPALTALSPPTALVGGPAFTLTIAGANFATRVGAQDVSVGPFLPQVQIGSTLLPATFISSGSLSVTVPSSLIAAVGPVQVRVINPGGSTSGALILNVTPLLSIATATLPAGTTGSVYLFRVVAAGGAPPYQWLASGLPAGLTMNPSTGDILGSPQTAGTYGVTVRLTDSTQTSVSRSFSLSIGSPAPVISTPSNLPTGTVGVSYAAGLDVSGGGSFSYSIGSGALPDGLRLVSAGQITGVPTKAGTFGFSVVASDNQGNSINKSFTILILPSPLTIADPTTTLTVGTAASITLGATGGVAPYRFGLTCTLPAGLALNFNVISGTPTTPGAASCQVTVTDSTGATANRNFTITVVAQPITFTGGTLPAGQVGVAYAATVTARGGTAPLVYSGSGLPDGLTLSSGGSIGGTPTTAGSFSVAVTVTDANRLTAAATFTVAIAPAPLTITTASLPDGVVGTAYSAGLVASGGTAPYTWAITGAPSGVTATSAGALGGTPDTAGSFTVSAVVTDANRATARASFTVKIAPPALVITTASTPGGTVGAAYAASFTATGGVVPFTWTASGVPAGLNLSTGGALSGTPTAPGTSNVSVTVRDSAGTTVSKSFSIVIALPAAPPVTFGGIGVTSNPLQQPRLTVSLGTPYPVDVIVTLTLTFAPDSGADDPAIQFSTGGRTVRITIPAGATSGATDVGIQTGTVAGVITVTSQLQASGVDVTPSPAPRQTVRIAPGVPVLTTVTGVRTSTGFTITITGFVTSREMTQAVFQFNPAAGTNLQTTSLTVPLDAVFAAYFGSTAATPFGGQFTFTQPFTVNGNVQGVASITVTLTNRVGTSAAGTATLN